jgi:hypothetical protein
MENEKILYNTGYGLSNSDSMQADLHVCTSADLSTQKPFTLVQYILCDYCFSV